MKYFLIVLGAHLLYFSTVRDAIIIASVRCIIPTLLHECVSVNKPCRVNIEAHGRQLLDRAGM